jgi:class 3 adenylate cyclase
MERLDARPFAGPVHLVHNIFIRHWKQPLADCIAPMCAAAEVALESGDLEYFTYNNIWAQHHRWLTSVPLDRYREEVDAAWYRVRKYRQDKGMLLLHQRHLADALQVEPHPPPDGDVDEDGLLQRWTDAEDGFAIAASNGWRGVAAFLNGDYARAAELLAVCDTRKAALEGESIYPAYRLYQALAQLRLAALEPDPSRATGLRKARQVAKLFVRWARASPANYGASSALLEAELAAAAGRPLDTIAGAYARAIAAYHAAHWTREEALANELAGRCLLGRDLHTAAYAHLAEARRLYALWGGTRRVALLDDEFTGLLGALPEREVPATGSTSSFESSALLDLQTVMRANHAISEALVVENVLAALLEITLENVGAQRGVLLLERDGALDVEAELGVGGQPLLEARPLAEVDTLPANIIRYVFRTGEDVVLHDAGHEGLFVADPYVRTRPARSVLCVPLVHRGDSIGVVYFENNLSTGVFTPERVELVKLLSGQAGVSIRNAQLYGRLERSLQEQVELAGAHARFVPHQFLNILNRPRITDVRLGDATRKELSILFSDIRGFTPLLEAMSTDRELLSLLNEYVAAVEPAILAHHGFIDSFHGDGIMALFDGGADSAVRGAIAMQDALRSHNEERARAGAPPLRTGIGLTTGSVMMGTIGTRNRMVCGVIGDAVNAAARVESLTPRYGASLLITGETYERLQDPAACTVRRVDRIRVVGKAQPVLLYQVLDAEGEAVRAAMAEDLPLYEQALDLYYAAAFDAALALLYRFLAGHPEDVVAALYADRCRDNRQRGVPPGWDGTVFAEHK